MTLKFRRIAAGLLATVMCCSVFASCGDSDDSSAVNSAADSATDSTTDEETANSLENIIYGEMRTEFNENLDLSDYPLTQSEVPEDYQVAVEAESGQLTGAAVVNEDSTASGGEYVNGINSESDRLTMTVEVEYSGFYDLVFSARSSDYKVNSVVVDDIKAGEITTDSSVEFYDVPLQYIYLEAGSHTIAVTSNWGYADYDALTLIAAQNPITEEAYNVTPELSNPNADDNTKRLFKFLCDVYGKYSISGQYAETGRESREYKEIQDITGKEFAVLGLDVGNYSLTSQANGATSNTIEYAYDWYNNAGGIVQLCWHWTSPEGYYIENDQQHWWSSFYIEASTIDLDKIMNGEDETGYQLLMDDIDNMAQQLARLRDAGVPVLWRPLHEASGGWFWWGNCDPESYKKLWNVMYDKMTNEHNLTNLIWVWNGQDPDWYPGDDTVDLVGLDIYAGERVDSSQSGAFADLVNNFDTESKLIALTENGCVMDPDKVMRDNSRWLFWGTWGSYFLEDSIIPIETYTTFELLEKAYNHERVLTLDELPDLKNYPLE